MCEVRVLLENYIVGQWIFSVRRVANQESSVGADNIVILLPIIITHSVLSPQLSPWHRKVGSPAARLASSRIVRKGQDDWTWEHSVGQRDTTLSPRYTGQELRQNQDLYQSWNNPRLQGLVSILIICYWLLSQPSLPQPSVNYRKDVQRLSCLEFYLSSKNMKIWDSPISEVNVSVKMRQSSPKLQTWSFLHKNLVLQRRKIDKLQTLIFIVA